MDSRFKHILEKCFFDSSQSAASIGIRSLEDFELGAIAESKNELSKLAPTVNGEMVTQKELPGSELSAYVYSYLTQAIENQLCPFVAELPSSTSSSSSSRFLLYTVRRAREPIFDTQILDVLISILNPDKYEPLFRDIYYTHHLFSLVWAIQGWIELPTFTSLPQFLATKTLRVHAVVRDILPNFSALTDARDVRVYVSNMPE